jgi:hypothetical protein
LREEFTAVEAESKSAFDDEAEEEKRVSLRLRTQHKKLNDLLQYLQWLSDAETKRVPWSLIATIDRLAAALLPEYKIIVSCADTYNYGIRWGLLRKYAVLSLPGMHRTNVLWHVLIGHELFHPIAAQYIARTRALTLDSLVPKCRKVIQESSKDKGLFDVLRMAREVTAIWEGGLTELLCDIGSVVLLGPSVCLASFSFALSRELDKPPSPPKFYPPWRYRLRVLLRFLDKYATDYDRLRAALDGSAIAGVRERSPGLTESFDTMRELVSHRSDEEVIARDVRTSMAYEAIEACIEEGYRFLLESIPAGTQTWRENIPQVPNLLDRLSQRIPPSEIVDCSKTPVVFTAAAFPAVMIASWLYEVDQVRKAANGAADLGMSYDALCRLTLKACEDAERRMGELPPE